MNSWGLHCIIDGKNGVISKITDQEHIKKFVSTLVNDIDMVAYGPTWIDHFATHDVEKSGISFCQMIETSNITGHFVDKNGDFYIDVFSCKEFDISTVVNLIHDFFGEDAKLNIRCIPRG